jgi:hypothetical protein
MYATVQERIHTISAHCDHNISRINDKFRISRINVLLLCGISRMSYCLMDFYALNLHEQEKILRTR